MKILRSIQEMQAQARQWREGGTRIGFVPTMGYLHEGHLTLVDLAKAEADVTVASIFVNPTQFGPEEDFARYPRDPTRDETLCDERGVDVVFYPTEEEMYAGDHSTWVVENTLSKPLCGESRPTHFRGVTTIVAKLFNAVSPDVAVFGQKDAQQALVIMRMVRDLSIPVEIVIGPIAREADGLAMSSRNRYLTADERERATSISRGLRRAEGMYAEGERRHDALCGVVQQEILDATGKPDYVELVSRRALAVLDLADEPALLAVAAFFGKTRLIDNCFLD